MVSSHDIPHMDHIVIFGGSELLLSPDSSSMSESGVPESSSFESSSMESGASTSESSCEVPTLLSKLKAPIISSLARKRKISSNPARAKRSKGAVVTEPKSISPAHRILDFPNEHLTVLGDKLFCSVCREPLSVKKSIVQNHIASTKHALGKERIHSKEKRGRDIVSMLKNYDTQVHPVGETLSDDLRVFRVKLVSSFLKAGVPLHKVDCFRELLEESSFSLSGSQHLRELIPCIQQEEVKKVKSEIAGRYVSVIFDGTTHVAEAMVIVLRFIDDNWKLQQRVVRLMLLAKSLTGEEVARLLISTLSTDLGISSNLLLAGMRDRASVNNVAIRTLNIVLKRVAFKYLFKINNVQHVHTWLSNYMNQCHL